MPLRIREWNGELVTIRNVNGLLRCECWDFREKRICCHINQVYNQSLYVEEEIISLPDYNQMRKEAQDALRQWADKERASWREFCKTEFRRTAAGNSEGSQSKLHGVCVV